MTKIAHLIKPLQGFSGTAALYKLTPSLVVGDDNALETHEYIVVSATIVMYSGPETYIFPANADGEVVDWLELPGSFKGALDIEQALRNAGYEPSGQVIGT